MVLEVPILIYFNPFDIYYSFLKEFISEKRDLIDGIDLDIEEYVELSKIENLIKLIKKDFGSEFIISMAPVQYAIRPIIQVWVDLFTKHFTRVVEN